MIFADGDATGFEEDAHLTAMWLWTLSTGGQETEEMDDEEESDKKGKKAGSTVLDRVHQAMIIQLCGNPTHAGQADSNPRHSSTSCLQAPCMTKGVSEIVSNE